MTSEITDAHVEQAQRLVRAGRLDEDVIAALVYRGLGRETARALVKSVREGKTTAVGPKTGQSASQPQTEESKKKKSQELESRLLAWQAARASAPLSPEETRAVCRRALRRIAWGMLGAGMVLYFVYQMSASGYRLGFAWFFFAAPAILPFRYIGIGLTELLRKRPFVEERSFLDELDMLMTILLGLLMLVFWGIASLM